MKLNSTLDVKRFQRIGLFRELNGAGQDVWEWPKHGRGNLNMKIKSCCILPQKCPFNATFTRF